jgi:hypothetical protein
MTHCLGPTRQSGALSLGGPSCVLRHAPAAILLARWRLGRPHHAVSPRSSPKLRVALLAQVLYARSGRHYRLLRGAINSPAERQIAGAWSGATAVEGTAAQASRTKVRSAVAPCQRCQFPSPRTAKATSHGCMTRAGINSLAAPQNVGAWSGAGLSRVLLHKPRAPKRGVQWRKAKGANSPRHAPPEPPVTAV